jgi:hypothetical protein
MSDAQLLEERLRNFLSTPDDADWEDVLRRTPASATNLSSGSSRTAATYRPRWSRRVALGGVGAFVLAGAVAAVLIVVLAGTSAPNAFAGWQATPTRPANGQTAAALSNCTTQLAAAEHSTTAADWQPVVTDTRGPFTAAILQGATPATCLTGPSFTTVAIGTNQPGGGPQPSLSIGGPNANAVNATVRDANGANPGPINTTAQAQTAADGQPYTLLQGRISSDATAVTLILSDGSHVQATVGAGAFIAWWPSHANAASAQVTSSTGVTTQPLAFTPKSTPPANRTGQSSNSAIKTLNPPSAKTR